MCNTFLAVCIAATICQADANVSAPESTGDPRFEGLEMRIHVAAGGGWTVSYGIAFRFDGEESSSREKRVAREFTNTFFNGLPTDIPWKTPKVSHLEGRRWRGIVKSHTIDDMSLLAHVLRESLEMHGETFSWDKNTFEIAGDSRLISSTGQSQEEPDIHDNDSGQPPKSDIKDVVVGMLIKAILTEILREHADELRELAENMKVTITTDGRIASTPAVFVDSEANALTIDCRQLPKLSKPHLSIRISDLQLPSGNGDETK